MISVLVADVSGRKIIKDEASTEVPFLTGDGRNGVRSYEIKEPDRDSAFNLTGIETDLRVTVKTNRAAVETELDASFPLTPSVTVAVDGTFTVDFSNINFSSFQDKVDFTLYKIVATKNIPICIMQSSIQLAGV